MAVVPGPSLNLSLLAVLPIDTMSAQVTQSSAEPARDAAFHSAGRPRLSPRRFADELANSITGGVGWLLSIAALVLLVVFASLYSSAWEIVACSIYGSTLILAYGATTLYHAFPWPGVKRVFHVFDHCGIFLLIAGTYTPIVLGPLRGGWGWSLFGVVWGLAVLGIVFRSVFGNRHDMLLVAVYVAMGWVGLVAIFPIMERVPGLGQLFLLIGGLSYTAGVGFYVIDHKLLFGHAIWHLFVLAGSIFHFFAVLFWVVLWPLA